MVTKRFTTDPEQRAECQTIVDWRGLGQCWWRRWRRHRRFRCCSCTRRWSSGRRFCAASGFNSWSLFLNLFDGDPSQSLQLSMLSFCSKITSSSTPCTRMRSVSTAHRMLRSQRLLSMFWMSSPNPLISGAIVSISDPNCKVSNAEI